MRDVIIIGAGASGLTAAITAARKGAKVTIIERNAKPGKKLLLTGNGRCNYWNMDQDPNHYHTQNPELFTKMYNLSNKKVLPFFASLGIVPKEINGYCYPFSMQATSILNALITTALNLKVEIIYDTIVNNVKKEGDIFTLLTAKGNYKCQKLIIACGSKATPKTGSTGIGYDWAQQWGHTLNPVLPALGPIKGADNFYKDWAKVRCEAILTLKENGQIIKEEKGELQLTEQGISGIVSFNLSGLVAQGLAQKYREEILINFMPWFQGTNQEFKNYLTKIANTTHFNLRTILDGFLNYKIGNLILKLNKYPADVEWDDVDQDNIIEMLRAFSFTAVATGDFANAQVCWGGITLKEINPYTLESLIVKNLYFVGEILDVTGDCGGYNLGFAWMSGIIAGEGVMTNA